MDNRHAGINERFLRSSFLPFTKTAVGRYALESVIFVIAYLALDWVSYIEPLKPFNITPWNPGPALAIVWIMHAGLARAPIVLVATFLADDVVRNLPADYGITFLCALVLTTGYTSIAEALRVLLRAERHLGTVLGLTLLVGVVALGTAINGFAFLGVLVSAGLLSAELWVDGWLRFWLGDVVGILVTAPLLLIAMDPAKRAKLAGFARRAESHLQIGLIGLTLWLLLAGTVHDPSHGLFLLFPPLIWITVRGGLVGALVAVTIVQLGVVIAFHQGVDRLPLLEMQVLVATLTLTGLYLGVAVDERQRTMQRLNESQHLAAAGEMAGAITHEVSQALTALASYSRSAHLRSRATKADAELTVLVEKIHAESVRASRVVRRLRDFFRAGSMRLQAVASAELLDMIGRLGTEATAGTAISFTSNSDPDLPPVLVDLLQIELVVRNLIANAVDSLEEHARGRGAITVRVTREPAKRLCIAVADTGPGIPAGADVFRPFASGKPSGMGLGLAVSRAIAEAHGGLLEVASAGHGEFHLLLPLEPVHG
jgi:signal transduction histidine kinase